jgi:diguanylate cyclase (GGDEF)-like protein
VSRPSRRGRSPALLRGRFRTLFFFALSLAALVVGHPIAALPAALGLLIGLCSIKVARHRGQDLAYTFAVLDWLLLGCALALAGGADSWLLGAVPVLTMGQLGVSPRRDWPYLLAPTLLLLIVLAIADPALGGSRAAGVAKLSVLVAGGVVAAIRLRPQRTRRRRPLRVDDSTGFYTAERLKELLVARMDMALAEHDPLSVVFLRLEHFEDCRNFLGQQGSEALVQGVARRLKRRLATDDLAFRVSPGAFVLALPGRSETEARALAAALGHDVSSNLIAGRRQTLAVGVSSFPTVRSLDDLMAAAREEAQPESLDRRPLPQAVGAAAAR